MFTIKNAIEDIFTFETCEKLTEQIKVRVMEFFSSQKQGISRKIYKHAKAMELVSDMIEQKNVNSNILNNVAMTLSSTDISKIQSAREILMKNLSSPPSLYELSSMINMNLNKLKKGFCYLYGLPPYKVLHKFRMEAASRLLSQRDMNVSEVAWAVGYASLGHFSSAFSRYFGVKPKTFQLEMTRFMRNEYGRREC
jgi:AraC-like DNA-binding protein